MTDFLRFEANIDLETSGDTYIARRKALADWLVEVAGRVRCDGYAGIRYDPTTGAQIGLWSVDGRVIRKYDL